MWDLQPVPFLTPELCPYFRSRSRREGGLGYPWKYSRTTFSVEFGLWLIVLSWAHCGQSFGQVSGFLVSQGVEFTCGLSYFLAMVAGMEWPM